MKVEPATREEVELAHEALIRYWTQLRDWLSEDRSSLLLRDQLSEAAHEWAANGRDEGFFAASRSDGRVTARR